MGLFLGYVLLRAWFSPVPYLAREDLHMGLGVLLVYLLTVASFSSPKNRWVVVGGMLGVALLNGFVSILQFSRGHTVNLFGFIEPADYGWRASGAFICPNHLAGFLEMAIPMGMSLALWSRRGLWARLAGGYVVMMGLAALMMTGSRAGLASLVCGLAVFGILSLMALHRAGHPRFRLACVAAVIGMVLAAGAAGVFISKSAALQTRTLHSLSSMRLELWSAALRQYQEARWVGTGGGSFLYYGRRFASSEVQADPVHVHNDYLELLAEYGLSGATLFALCFAVHLAGGWSAFRWFITERGQKLDRKSTRLNSSHLGISYAVFCLK